MCWVEPKKAVAMLVLGSTNAKMGQLLCPTTTSGISTLWQKLGPRMCWDCRVELKQAENGAADVPGWLN